MLANISVFEQWLQTQRGDQGTKSLDGVADPGTECSAPGFGGLAKKMWLLEVKFTFSLLLYLYCRMSPDVSQSVW